MQNQEHSYDNLPEAPEELANNTDPREQPRQQEYAYQTYEEGYTGLNTRDIWSEGEKLRPEPKSEKSVNGPLSLIVLLCAAFIAGSFFHLGFGWLNWLIVIVLVIVGIGALASNWREVIIPMPTRTFQVLEHTRLVITNGAGRISVRRGEESTISVAATKRASGFGISPERMQIDYDQRGDTLNISSRVGWSLLQFGLRAVDFEITVPANSDVQIENGSGRVAVQGTSGVIRARTGSGRIQAHDLQGQIAMKTGSGRIESSNLQGQIDLRTGSSRIEASNLRGQVTAQTGSGHIDVRQAELRGNSLLKTGSSSITFEGSLDPQGAYNFATGSGGINVILPTDASFNLDAKTGSGGVKNEFGNKEVGSQPRAQLRLRSGSGSIRIARGGMY